MRELERVLLRIRELDDERHGLVAEARERVGRLGDLGLGAEQVAEFVQQDLSWLACRRSAAAKSSNARLGESVEVVAGG